MKTAELAFFIDQVKAARNRSEIVEALLIDALEYEETFFENGFLREQIIKNIGYIKSAHFDAITMCNDMERMLKSESV